ncbi:unnamed protein product [Didymodactylos carnosus]|uniref:Uncharacterized protein n=1 Tax=Didymodactylos carnosus TaxID=1234261 RepID=A0A815RID0_9BILA|nr:unnamed protein product [Didymodactylos carnosus]CAF4343291.1 unnamed protein product [Didymodactylos carnosus]
MYHINIPPQLTIELIDVINSDPQLNYPNLSEHIIHHIESTFSLLFSVEDKTVLNSQCKASIQLMKLYHYSDSSDTDETLLTTKTSADLPITEIIPQDNHNIFHWKLKHNISDHAMNEIHHINNTMPSVWSLRNFRQKMNENINVINTEFGSYIRVEDVIKTLIHTNQTSISRIRRSMTIRLSIDGTQVGEKVKLLVLLVSCPEFSSRTQQTAFKLLPIGLFKMEDENYDNVKQVIPDELIKTEYNKIRDYTSMVNNFQ